MPSDSAQDPDASQDQIPGQGPGDKPVGVTGSVLVTLYLIGVAVALIVALHCWWSKVDCNASCQPVSSRPTVAAKQGTAPPAPAGRPAVPAPKGAKPPEKKPPEKKPAVQQPPSPPNGPTGGAAAPTPELTVTSVTPNSGSSCGGTRVTIAGRGFPKDSAKLEITFGGESARDVRVETDGKSVQATTPAYAAGPVDLVVRNTDTAGSTTLSKGFTYACPPEYDANFFLFLLFAGGLGGTVHALRSLYWYVGNRKFIRSWILMYLLLPITGGLLGAVFFIVIRAGFISDTRAGNPFFLLTLGILAGMFSRQATDKLKMIVEAILTSPAPGADSVGGLAPSPAPLQITAIEPGMGFVDGQEVVTITGTGFDAGTHVTFDGIAATDIKVDSNLRSLQAKTPAHAAGKVDVTVTNSKKQSFSWTNAFTYTPVKPYSGNVKGGDKVTVTGAAYATATAVTFGGTPGTNLKLDASGVTVQTPPHAAGKVDVVVTVPGAGGGASTNISLPGSYLYKA